MDWDNDLSSLLRSAGLLHTRALRKSRGQNFLRDAGCARRIADCCDVGRGGLASSLVVEIGAGGGALTRALFRQGARRVVAIESDVRLVSVLRRWEKTLDEGGVLEVVEADARKTDYAALVEERGWGEGSGRGEVVIVGNLPYSVGTVILRKILEDDVGYALMVLMFQREVAERMTAEVGDSAYGRLSILVGLRCRVERCFDVAPGVFFPVPKVFSRVLRFHRREDDGVLGYVSDEDYGLVAEMTGLLFSYRRKRMSTVLRMAGRDDWIAAGEGWVDCSRRAGEVGIGEWLRWARAVRTQKTQVPSFVRSRT